MAKSSRRLGAAAAAAAAATAERGGRKSAAVQMNCSCWRPVVQHLITAQCRDSREGGRKEGRKDGWMDGRKRRKEGRKEGGGGGWVGGWAKEEVAPRHVLQTVLKNSGWRTSYLFPSLRRRTDGPIHQMRSSVAIYATSYPRSLADRPTDQTRTRLFSSHF